MDKFVIFHHQLIKNINNKCQSKLFFLQQLLVKDGGFILIFRLGQPFNSIYLSVFLYKLLVDNGLFLSFHCPDATFSFLFWPWTVFLLPFSFSIFFVVQPLYRSKSLCFAFSAHYLLRYLLAEHFLLIVVFLVELNLGWSVLHFFILRHALVLCIDFNKTHETEVTDRCHLCLNPVRQNHPQI